MKLKRLERCPFEERRFSPVFDRDGLARGGLVETEEDRAFFEKMIDLYLNDPCRFEARLRRPGKRKDLEAVRAWMIEKTPGLDDPGFAYKFRHRMVWIAHGLRAFPACPVCGKEIGLRDNEKCWRTSPKTTSSNGWNYKEHCCKIHAEMDPSHQEKVEAGVRRSLGVDYPVRDRRILETVLEKGRRTYRERTGYRTHFENPEYQKENAERIRRGMSDPAVRARILGKTKETRSRFTKEYRADIERRRLASRMKSVGSPNYRWGTRYYEYDGLQFDSSWELYAWIWYRDGGFGIRRCGTRFEYECLGKVHGCYVDFEVDGELVEVKGDQFFSRRGDPGSPMIYPYFRDRTDPEVLKRRDALMQARQACMLRHGVRFLTWKDIRPMKDYVDRTYGRKYVEQFRKGAPGKKGGAAGGQKASDAV